MRLLKNPEKKLLVDLAHQAASHVVSELNNPRTLGNDAVQRLADMLNHLHRLRFKEGRGESIHPDELAPVNNYLARHRWIAQLVVTSDPVLYFQHQEVLEPTDIPGAVEQRLASAVIAMASDGTLERVQRCDECAIWFYGRLRSEDPAKGTFCCPSHRKKFWRKKPGMKERLREYQSTYYRDVLSPVTSRTVRQGKRRKRA